MRFKTRIKRRLHKRHKRLVQSVTLCVSLFQRQHEKNGGDTERKRRCHSQLFLGRASYSSVTNVCTTRAFFIYLLFFFFFWNPSSPQSLCQISLSLPDVIFFFFYCFLGWKAVPISVGVVDQAENFFSAALTT